MSSPHKLLNLPRCLVLPTLTDGSPEQIQHLGNSWTLFNGKKDLKGTVSVISSYHPCKYGNARFTTIPSKVLSDQVCFYLHKLRWNLKNLTRGLNPPKPGLN